MIKPMLSVGYSYAAIDDGIDTTSSFEGGPAVGNPTFVTSGPVPNRNSFNAGAGITYMTTANWDMSANYNYDYRTDYRSQSGFVRLTSHF